MNIWRGLLRLWVVLSFCWVAWIGANNYIAFSAYFEKLVYPERIQADQDKIVTKMSSCIGKLPEDPDRVRKCLSLEEFVMMTRGDFPTNAMLQILAGIGVIGIVLVLVGFVWRGFRPT
jgi:hypothetical protein